ncbi:family 78 glycoside hydrolase catalytic domain [candidate division KSB1 bacterium]|nr:family 78 glycoside hydrolase catalytic domain [candidate division KSB1 bacterium]
MKNSIIVLILTFMSLTHFMCNPDRQSDLIITKMHCEYTENPTNIDQKSPHFSWMLASDIQGQKQTAYQILVSESKIHVEKNQGDLWDSGVIPSSQSNHLPYQGAALESNGHYFWKVVVFDKNNKRYESEIASFETALLDGSDWRASWIGAGPVKEPRAASGFFKSVKEQYACDDTVVHNGRSVLLRNEFSCPQEIKRARVFVTGLGFYELYLNGERVGDHVLAPAKTNYRKQVLYDTYDVTNQLQQGQNAIGIHLGNGWFNPYKKWWRPYRMQWFGAKRALLQLHVEYTNGETEIITSNDQWKHAPGPVLFNCIYDGELYDATEEIAGWATPEFDDTDWRPVNIVEKPGGELVSHIMPPTKVIEEITPVQVFKPKPGVVVYDMGQNFAGWAKIKMTGRNGSKIQLRFAEDIFDDGNIDITSNEHAKATTTYIMKGEGVETYEPRFSYFGFKYVEITGEPELPQIESVKGCVVHTAFERTGSFTSGNETINKIHNATVWSQKSNSIGYPLDCPQRDERLGWFGDAQVTAEEAMFNFDMPLFYRNWFSGIRLNQHEATGDIPIISPRPYIWDEGVEWSSSYIVMTWLHYVQYGDARILAEHFAAMQHYMQFLDSLATDYIVPSGWIGDWGSLVKDWREGEPVSVPTAFYFWNANILAKMATVLDKAVEAQHFIDLAARIKQAYNKNFLHPSTNDYNDDSQMANAFPLFLGLVPEENQQAVLDNLIHNIVEENDGHLTTGVLGSKYMIEALTLYDRADIAWLLATQTGYPSWSDMVEKYTTMCEFWTLKQSHNHVMTGSIDAFFYKTLAGIRLDESSPGFEKVTIKPYIPENLSHAYASIETVKGTLESGWEKQGEELHLHIRIPVNSEAQVHIPATDTMQIYESGQTVDKVVGITFLRSENDRQVFRIVSGDYRFIVK